MKISGYSKHERYHTITGAIERYRDMKHDVMVGIRESIYRSGDMIRQAKLKKQDWSNTWFLQGEIRKTISCSVTPGKVLKKKQEKAINTDSNTQTKVKEDGGIPIHCGL